MSQAWVNFRSSSNIPYEEEDDHDDEKAVEENEFANDQHDLSYSEPGSVASSASFTEEIVAADTPPENAAINLFQNIKPELSISEGEFQKRQNISNKKRKPQDPSVMPAMSEMLTVFKSAVSEDEFDTVGKMTADVLRKITDKRQQFLAKSKVLQVLNEIESNNLFPAPLPVVSQPAAAPPPAFPQFLSQQCVPFGAGSQPPPSHTVASVSNYDGAYAVPPWAPLPPIGLPSQTSNHYDENRIYHNLD